MPKITKIAAQFSDVYEKDKRPLFCGHGVCKMCVVFLVTRARVFVFRSSHAVS